MTTVNTSSEVINIDDYTWQDATFLWERENANWLTYSCISFSLDVGEPISFSDSFRQSVSQSHSEELLLSDDFKPVVVYNRTFEETMKITLKDILEAIPATFTRSSTAYKQDGSVVNANVPRFEADGVMVEEGTTNLVPNPNFSNWTGELPANWTKNTISAVEKTQGIYAGTNAIKVANTTSGYLNASVVTVSANTAYTVSAITKGGAGAVRFGILVGYYTSGNVFISKSYIATTQLISTDWSKKQFQITTPAAAAVVSIGFWIHTTVADNPAYIDYVQLEAKPYATSFHPTTRTAESLAIPASAIPVSEGTIEFDVVMSVLKSCKLFYAHDSNSKDLSIGTTNTGRVTVQHFQTETGISSYLATNAKYRIGFKYDANSISLFINGVITYQRDVTGVHASFLYAFLGSLSASVYQANALFSNLRISNKARSDEELANTGALSVDEYTTYFAPLNGSLDAEYGVVSVVQRADFYSAIDEDFSLSDGIRGDFSHSLSESICLSDFIKSSFLANVYEDFLLSDSFGSQFSKKHFDSFVLSDNARYSLSSKYPELFALSDSISSLSDFRRLYSENLLISDSLFGSFGSNFYDDFSLSDSFIRGIDFALGNLGIKTTDLDLTSFLSSFDTPFGYSPFQEFIVGEYEYDQAIFRTTISSLNHSVNTAINKLDIHVDIPDTVDRGTAVLFAENTFVSFNKTYYTKPEVNVNINGGISGEVRIPHVTEITLTGFYVELRDLTNSLVSGQISWTSNGY